MTTDSDGAIALLRLPAQRGYIGVCDRAKALVDEAGSQGEDPAGGWGRCATLRMEVQFQWGAGGQRSPDQRVCNPQSIFMERPCADVTDRRERPMPPGAQVFEDIHADEAANTGVDEGRSGIGGEQPPWGAKAGWDRKCCVPETVESLAHGLVGLVGREAGELGGACGEQGSTDPQLKRAARVRGAAMVVAMKHQFAAGFCVFAQKVHEGIGGEQRVFSMPVRHHLEHTALYSDGGKRCELFANLLLEWRCYVVQ
jgi:hypothetical protein